MYFIRVYVTLNWRTGHKRLVWSIRNLQLEQCGREAMLCNDFIREARGLNQVGPPIVLTNFLIVSLTCVFESRNMQTATFSTVSNVLFRIILPLNGVGVM